MARKNKRFGERREFRREKPQPPKENRLSPDAKKSIWAVVFLGVAVLLVLAAVGKAGPAGDISFNLLESLLGVGYFVLPGAFLLLAVILLFSEKQRSADVALLGIGFVVLSVLGIIHIFSSGQGGWLGFILGSLKIPFGATAATVINIIIMIASLVVAANAPIRVKRPAREKEETLLVVSAPEAAKSAPDKETAPEKESSSARAQEDKEAPEKEAPSQPLPAAKPRSPKSAGIGNYVPPPLSLLKSASDKPTTGDLLANANIIKRTLDSFGIAVEMGEINVGPAVTRYTLKPAEGMKLSRIEALHKDLALALAAHPIRIEAPIPGKSLVGIEVPNKAAALVRLGSLMNYPEFQKSGFLGFALGRDVSGEPVFADIDKMPHLLVAGATGAGKSILIHSLLVSLLYKNSPATLRMILIDPKRVELSIYENLPHLVSPVIVESKKTISVFKWAINEMERRYDILLQAGARDIKSYNQNLPRQQAGGAEENPLPYLLIVVDELADLMASYGREVEGSIVRLAQMARATGLHLILSTQRPSVEVITGLIKANITSRVALQVASQVDSRTILDASGAEKLLGHGDLLYISAELSKPKRIQGTYITEEEIRAVADHIKKNNRAPAEEVSFSAGGGFPPPPGFGRAGTFGGENGGHNGEEAGPIAFDDYAEGDDDELYEEAIRVVSEAKKASASLLQRRLKVGYARAARLLDMMEERGVIGPGEGAKPREVYLDRIQKQE